MDDLFVEKTELLGGATERGLLNPLEVPSSPTPSARISRKAGAGTWPRA